MFLSKTKSKATRRAARLIPLIILLGPMLQPGLLAQAIRVLAGAATSGPAHHASRVLVRFQNGASFLPQSGANRSLGRGVYLVENPAGVTVAETLRRYKANPNVLYVEPDYQVTTTAIPTDPLWSQQWDMTKIQAPAAWNILTGANDVIVAIIDTGINFTHPDLQANLWTNPANGSHGFTCLNGTCTAGGQDDQGHGTHVAGTIGAAAGNGTGIAGINWDARMMACKFLDSNGSGSVSDAILCFNQILNLKQQGFNIRVTNNSWGGGGFSQALKDAMAATEAAGVVHVCAAGNSGQNADLSPMYPGAYDNRGIISVLASDQNDGGAGFTNYGILNVDIAAPGVSTLSTVPTGSCALCDPSGYKLLSGTSMAAPHVAGVLAGLFHQNNALTAAEARDIILDPASYDAVTETRARSTSTGGRLNFAKVLNSPLVLNPRLNNFPVVAMTADVFTTAGNPVNIAPNASDPDQDTLRTAWSKSAGAGTAWLQGWMLNEVFPSPSGNTASFTAPSIANTATVPYSVSVADGRGGGAGGRSYVTVTPGANNGVPPSGNLTVSNNNPAAGSAITVNFPVTDANGGQTAWNLWASSAGSTIGWCCFTGTSTSVTLNAGVYRLGAQAIDPQLNLSTRRTVVVKAGGATGEPPVAAATLSSLSGSVPFTVNIDMSASHDPDGTIQGYYADCGSGSWSGGAQPSFSSCTFTTPGSYWILIQVQDNNGNLDTMDAYVAATPINGPPAPLTVSLTSPAAGATITGTVTLAANASGSTGVSKVDFYRDSGVLLGTANAAPYNVTWNSGSAAAGAHTLYAVATGTTSNTATSAVVSINVTAPLAVSITSPAANAGVTGNISITANASGGPGIQKVDFYRDAGVLLGTDTGSPYGITWNSGSVASGPHSLYAIVTDTAANTATSATVPINVNAPLAVSITSPAANAGVTGNVSITANASGGPGVQKVDFYRDAGVLLGTATASPYSITWNSGSVASGAHSLYAIATDTATNTATSTAVPINVNPPLAVSITSPAANASLAGNVSITASATGGTGSRKVDFYRDAGILLGTANASPYSITWNSAAVSPGTHTLYAIATDLGSTSVTATSVAVPVTVNAPLTVSITSPAANASLSGNVSITASATGGTGSRKVDFYRDGGVSLGTASSSPYSITWNSGSVAAGAHSLYAIVTDLGTTSVTATSAAVPVTVVAALAVSITSPTANASVFGNVSITASASGGTGIAKVDFYRDTGVLIGTAATAPYSVAWNAASVPGGAHNLYAITTDGAGRTATSALIPVTVVVAPQVSISVQPNTASVARKSNVTITAAVTPGTLGVARVDFLVNGSVACSDTASEYSCTWQVPAATGKTYKLEAKAYDTQGWAGASNSIAVTSR